jgi:hypothetical protein
VWEENSPTTHTLNKGEFLITDIDLCDGTWRVLPRFTATQPARLCHIGRFESPTDKDDLRARVWTGRIESPPAAAFLEKECIERLNADRED